MTKPPHIIDVTAFFARDSGGVRRYLFEKGKWLKAQGLSHTLVTPGPKTVTRPGKVRLKSPLIPLAKGYRLPLDLRAWHLAMHQLQPSLIEFADPYMLGWRAIRTARSLGVPVVGFIHSDLPRLLETRLGAWTTPHAQRYVATLYGRADMVLAPSRHIRDKFADLGLHHVHHQPLGVDLDIFHPNRSNPQLKQQLHVPENHKLLIYAGRDSMEKNLSTIFAALRILRGKPYHLLLVGPDHCGGLPKHQCTAIPYVHGNRSLARLLASADAFVHAGDQETFGLAVVEAMASGLPVVGAEAAAIPELLQGPWGIMAPPKNPHKFAEAIEALCTQEKAEIGQQARQWVETHASWPSVFTKLLGHYRQLSSDMPQELNDEPNARKLLYRPS